ncbi:hypothetical protein CAPTEDRAFT_131290, partial [Capitella teleta]
LTLYKAKICLTLEYASPVLTPHLKKHINNIERIQMRATKTLPNLRHLPYPQQMKKLGTANPDLQTTTDRLN